MALDDGRVVSNFVSQALLGQNLTIYGDGKQTRSFQFISDLISGMVKMMDNNEVVGPINLGNPGEFTMLELAKLVQEIVNPKADIVFMENTSDDPNRRQPDITKAKTLLGWEPVVPLREGLAMMVDDFRTRLTRLGDKVVA
mmetsp:Transcript_19502/g.46569  ORF Transcript_19502/g.46569 Transcript_19502/m.46569 type:complete len:141 (-) Transcript_19502:230-652(-)|eukprot:CAMPEP_0177603432 /NCGR_PEP_ID=MMETSP0419_2-20121207/15511_1 /TAXON_ID=582737 /ORGANISM="Tetraselmis sp., Strain GSL018" /LENGTH=140 /DNA_ID=CAMNT_0019097207 /DNA_START=1219 /DNA_END=1641 /DNA_ORIENTATION=+